MQGNGTPGRRAGFTLLELLAVVAIMGLLMTVAVAAFVNINRGSAIKASLLNVRSALNLTRQQAITKRTDMHFSYGNTNWGGRLSGFYAVLRPEIAPDGATNFTRIGEMGLTKDGVLFAGASPDRVVFRSDGSCGGPEWPGAGTARYRKDIVLLETLPDGTPRPRGLALTTEVFRLTGRIRGKGWVNE